MATGHKIGASTGRVPAQTKLPNRIKKRVLLILPNLSGGGAERTSLNLKHHLDPKQFDVELALLEARGEYLGKAEFEHCISPPDSFFQRLALRFAPDSIPRGIIQIFILRSLIIARKPDVVMTSMADVSLPMAFAWLLLPRLRHEIRWLAREGNDTESVLQQTIQNSFLRHVIKKCISWAYNHSDGVIATSEGVAKGLATYFDLPRYKQIVIANPVDITLIHSACAAPPPMKLPDRFIVAVGRLSHQKGFDLLLHAFANLNEPDVHLVVLGKGPEDKALRQLAQKLSVNDRVHWLGFINNPWAIMARAEVFCLSSRWEGFGHVIVEAMACEVPVVVSDCPHGPADIIDNGTYGILVAPKDTKALCLGIAKVLKRTQDVHDRKEAALLRAHDYSAERIATIYAKAFERKIRV